MEYKVKYLIGYPGWDSKKDVIVVVGKNAIRIVESFTSNQILIKGKDLIDVSFESKSKRSGAKAATGALVGGILTGGIGLLAGAALGAQASDKSELVITFKEKGRERVVLLQTKEQTNAIYNALQDVIAYVAENPEAEPSTEDEIHASEKDLAEQLKTSQEKMNAGCMVFLAIIVGGIALLA